MDWMNQTEYLLRALARWGALATYLEGMAPLGVTPPQLEGDALPWTQSTGSDNDGMAGRDGASGMVGAVGLAGRDGRVVPEMTAQAPGFYRTEDVYHRQTMRENTRENFWAQTDASQSVPAHTVGLGEGMSQTYQTQQTLTNTVLHQGDTAYQNLGGASHHTAQAGANITVSPTFHIQATVREQADLDALVAQISQALEAEIARSAERAYS